MVILFKNMKSSKIILVFIALFIFWQNSYAKGIKKNLKKQREYTVTVVTTKGDIVFTMFNETPLHRDNFIKLAKGGFYNGVDFHRVVNNFVIQAGDPTTVFVYDHFNVGSSSIGYTINSEIVEGLHHFRGVVGMAREDDDINPERASSGSHFYIITGKRNLTDSDFEKAEVRSGIKLDDKVKQEYIERGGSPHLDGAYTIFGYVTSGMDVVDAISASDVNEVSVPVEPIEIKKIVIKKR